MAPNERIIKFYHTYSTDILPKLQQFEQKRKTEKQKVFLVGILAFVLLVGILINTLSDFLPSPKEDTDNKFIISTVRKTPSKPIPSRKFRTILLYDFGAIILIPSLFIWYAKDKEKSFRIELKVKCNRMIEKAIGDIEWYSTTGFSRNIADDGTGYMIGSGELLDSGLFPVFDERSTDDEFKGTYKDVPFRICETALFAEKQIVRTKTKVFNGIVIVFPANKEIKEKTIVITKHDANTGIYWYKNGIAAAVMFVASYYCFYILCNFEILYKYGINKHLFTPFCFLFFGVLFCSGYLIKRFYYQYSEMRYLNNRQFQKIELEDTKFAKRFCVYSSDQIEARYLVTTAFMERLYNLKTTFGAKFLKCSFFEGRIMIAISTDRDLFEIGSLYKSLEDTESINSFFNEIYSILELIDYFKLNEKTGL